jgi:hypothetical protein
MVGTAIYLFLVTVLVGLALWLWGLTPAEVCADRAVNLVLVCVVASRQEWLRRFTNALLLPYWKRRRYEVLRPIVGIGSIFLIQAPIYLLLMPLLQVRELGLVIGLTNVFAGSIGQWLWQEKWAWAMLRWQWGSNRVSLHVARLRAYLARTRVPERVRNNLAQASSRLRRFARRG